MTNRNLEVAYALSIGTKIDDLEWPSTAISSNFDGILHYLAYLGATTAKRMTVVSGNIRRVRIFSGVPLGGGVKWQWSCRRWQFLAIWVATSSETIEIRPAILHGDMLVLPLVGLYMIAKWMTLSAECLFHVKIRFWRARLSRAYLCAR